MSTPPGSISATWEPDPQPDRDRSVLWRVLAIVFAVVAAVLGVLLFRAGADRPLTTSAEASVSTACEVLGEIDPEATDMGETYHSEGFVTLQQIDLVMNLGWLAYTHDESYEDIRDSLMLPREVSAQTFALEGADYLEGADFQDAIDQARAACTEREQD